MQINYTSDLEEEKKKFSQRILQKCIFWKLESEIRFLHLILSFRQI
jgi:hypothetical protein